jgi:hypothetical protein
MPVQQKPSINDPREATRELQEIVRAVRARIGAAELLVNSIEARLNNLSTTTATTSTTLVTVAAGGTDQSIQLNNQGAIDGNSNFTIDAANGRLSAPAFNLGGDQPIAIIDNDLWSTALGLYLQRSDGVTKGPFIDADDLIAGANVSITPLTGGAYLISATGGGSALVIPGVGITVTALTGGAVEVSNAGVLAIVAAGNTLTGTVQLEAGSGITLTLLTGNVVQISATGGGGGVSSFNGQTGAVSITAGSNVTITPLTGGAFEIAATSGSGVTSLNGETGAVSIVAGSNVTVTPLTGGAIQVAATSGSGGFTYPTLLLDQDPHRFYEMQELSGSVMVDSSPNLIDGAYVNLPILGEPGILIDGGTTTVLLNPSSLTGAPTGYATFAVDIVPAATAYSWFASCLVRLPSVPINGHFFTVDSSPYMIAIGIGSGNTENAGTELLVLNQYVVFLGTGFDFEEDRDYHIAAGKVGSGLWVYVDGVLRAVFSLATPSPATDTRDVYLGIDGFVPSNRSLTCRMSHFAFFAWPAAGVYAVPSGVANPLTAAPFTALAYAQWRRALRGY